MGTKIEWATDTWNPVTGCTPISEGCAHCYAQRMASRLAGRFGYPADEPFRVTLHEDKMGEPFGWRKPRRVFVCSMGDLFHEDVPVEWIRQMFYVMVATPRHVYMLLTKRPRRMRDTIRQIMNGETLPANIWLGVTAENQARADERIPVLLEIPAAVRFVSVEPMLGPIDMTEAEWGPKPMAMTVFGFTDGIGREAFIQWIICGSETGPGARPMNLDWARDLRDQCVGADVAFFFKRGSDGSRELDGRLWEQYPGAVS